VVCGVFELLLLRTAQTRHKDFFLRHLPTPF
jgi:hypothetical protein